eukprot:6200517-Amphidinium_carterae.2
MSKNDKEFIISSTELLTRNPTKGKLQQTKTCICLLVENKKAENDTARTESKFNCTSKHLQQKRQFFEGRTEVHHWKARQAVRTAAMFSCASDRSSGVTPSSS